MDRFVPSVNSTSRGCGEAPQSEWDVPDRAGHISELVSLLGPDCEPDTQFFVESWTSGVERAAKSFQHRRGIQNNVQQQNEGSLRRFSSYVSAFSAAEFMDVQARAWGIQNPATQTSHSKESENPGQNPGKICEAIGSPALQRACCTLGVGIGSTGDQIKSAYRRLVYLNHPDRMQEKTAPATRSATAKMAEINAAYRVLRAARATQRA